MEGFLQSLKFKNIEEQKQICLLIGKQAKFKGQKKKWYKTHTLWWKGIEIDRFSKEYKSLITKAYKCLYLQNQEYKNILNNIIGPICHSKGNKNPNYTVLTEKEFVDQLNKLRKLGGM